MSQNFLDNTLYEMDNLIVLRGMNSETIDLIATDPPFNTKRNRSATAGFYVDKWKYGDTNQLPDQWKWWNVVHPKWLEEIKDGSPELYQVIETTRLVQGEDTAAFLCFLSVRLLEMHRILKSTGSIYLHCDLYCPPKFGPLPKPRLWYNIHDLKGGPDGETKTKKLHP